MLNQLTLNNFPRTGLSLTFGYGSKVVKQGGARHSDSDLIDIIFVVDDSLKWHEENLRMNSQHYSALKYLSDSAKKITYIQENFGAKIYFNPYVSIANLAMKYGVINTEHLIDDLLDWRDLYVAGRLHKPVEIIVNTFDKNERLRNAFRFNKESAIRAALLQLPETFDPTQLYRTIAGLSYHGDPRMLFGEDRNKVDNIVHKQVERFDQLYLPIIKMSQHFKESVQFNDTKRVFTQDLSSNVILKNLRLLPRNVKRNICATYGPEARTIESDSVLASLSRNIDCKRIVASAIARIVRKSSLAQSIKGIFTAGMIKTLKYSQRKLQKSLSSRGLIGVK